MFRECAIKCHEANQSDTMKMLWKEVLNVFFLGQESRILNVTEMKLRSDWIWLKHYGMEEHLMKWNLAWSSDGWKVKSHFENWFSCKIDWFFYSCLFHCFDSSNFVFRMASMANLNKLRITLNIENWNRRTKPYKKMKSSQSSFGLANLNGEWQMANGWLK